MVVKDVDEKSFDAEVLKSKMPVIVDLWAPWCGPCRIYGPIIDEISNEYENKVKFVKVNVDENEGLAAKYNIESIPTTLFMQNGGIKAMRVGTAPKEDLKKWINSYI
jgi:thioredoxin 1